jgi:hypothetical protein
MTHEELIKEILQLPLKDKMGLLETISRSVREEMRPREQNGSVVSRLRGIAKSDGPSPTDEELKEDYTRYLSEKYS